MEDYAAKMALKTDAALREYVLGYAQYREAAVLAALDELQRRGQPAPEEISLRPQLEAAVQEQRQAYEAAAPSRLAANGEAIVPEAEQPVLYTPGVIVLFSVLFSTIAGAVLLALNLRQVKRAKVIWGLAAFLLLYLAGEGFLISALLHRGNINVILLSILNLPVILIYVLWFWPRYVGTYQFQSRNWLVPLLICLIIKVGLNLLALYVIPKIPGAEQLFKQSLPQ